jgi:hypothetical protein
MGKFWIHPRAFDRLLMAVIETTVNWFYATPQFTSCVYAIPKTEVVFMPLSILNTPFYAIFNNTT